MSYYTPLVMKVNNTCTGIEDLKRALEQAERDGYEPNENDTRDLSRLRIEMIQFLIYSGKLLGRI